MTRVVVRLILTILLAPLTLVMGFSTLAFVNLGPFSGPRDQHLVAFLLSAEAYVLALLFGTIWAGVVRWNRLRRRRTFWACSSAIILGVLAIFLSLWPNDLGEGVLVFIVGINAAIAIMLVASFPILWRESASERRERLASITRDAARCPHCRYDLAGATTLTCSECGLSFTLGTLLQETTRRSGTEAFD